MIASTPDQVSGTKRSKRFEPFSHVISQVCYAPAHQILI